MIAAITIGQSPRPDLINPLRLWLPQHEIIEFGALDLLTADQLPDADHARYPLATTLRNGQRVKLPEDWLLPHLQTAVDKAENAGANTIVLMCAGTFSTLHSKRKRPLFRPFSVGNNLLKAMGLRKIGFVTPVAGQEKPIFERWSQAGYSPTVWAADFDRAASADFGRHITQTVSQHQLEAIVLDYVGHSPEVIKQLQTISPVPVLDLGQLTMAAVASIS